MKRSVAKFLLADVSVRALLIVSNNKFLKMKIQINELKYLMTKHIFLLSDEELKALAFILDIEITKLKKSSFQIEFIMSHKSSTLIVECDKNSNCSIGRKKKGKGGISGLTSWGGVFSFASVVSISRKFFGNGYELTLQDPDKLKVYQKEEWHNILFLRLMK